MAFGEKRGDKEMVLGCLTTRAAVALTSAGESASKAGKYNHGIARDNHGIAGGKFRGKGVEGRKVEAVDGEEIRGRKRATWAGGRKSGQEPARKTIHWQRRR